MLSGDLLKKRIKNILYLCGVVGFLHKLRNKNTLSIVMFHRVLAKKDIRWQGCDPEWTMSDDVFNKCIVFLKKHYNIVSLADVCNSYRKEETLPGRSLLITFDDGWADNEEYALPILQQHNVPAVIFIVANAVNSEVPFWEEHLFEVWKRKQLSLNFKDCLPASIPPIDLVNEKGLKALIEIVNGMPFEEKQIVVEKLIGQLPLLEGRAMLTSHQTCNLVEAGVALGSHGMTHNSLLQVTNLKEELVTSKDTVQHLLNEYRSSKNICLSFPHGSYNKQVTETAFEVGYQLLFTSDPFLAHLSDGQLDSRILGRISIPQDAVTEYGEFSESKLAFWLMNRTARNL